MACDHRLWRGIAGGPKGKLKSGVRALYEGAPTLSDLREFGLTLESDEVAVPNDDGWYYDKAEKGWRCEIWAENWPALRFYTQWSSQWRAVSGMGGVYYIGLDFGVLLQMLDRLGLEKDEYDDMLGCLREIEHEAIRHLNKPA